ncbi:MAG: hypothetical protein E6943_06490 [Actinomyces sp.]|uniref:hypothetical protein n=1 Tax=Schaalia radingae TaxID=131110 RepID=UPI0012FF8C56|nr:hypothetical protein [Schaalia radingae]MDU1352347.1 hypothetical protein [Actinomyces sp.]
MTHGQCNDLDRLIASDVIASDMLALAHHSLNPIVRAAYLFRQTAAVRGSLSPNLVEPAAL